MWDTWKDPSRLVHQTHRRNVSEACRDERRWYAFCGCSLIDGESCCSLCIWSGFGSGVIILSSALNVIRFSDEVLCSDIVWMLMKPLINLYEPEQVLHFKKKKGLGHDMTTQRLHETSWLPPDSRQHLCVARAPVYELQPAAIRRLCRR